MSMLGRLTQNLRSPRSQPPYRNPPIDLLTSCLCAFAALYGLAFFYAIHWSRPWYTWFIQTDSLVFLGNTLLLLAALRYQAQNRPDNDRHYRLACAVLLATQFLTIAASLLQIQASSLIVFVAIYIGSNFALAFIVPLKKLPRLQVLQLGADTLLAVVVSDVLLHLLLPLVVENWSWTAFVTSAELRLVTSIGLTFWYVAVYRRFAAFGGRLVVLWGLGVLCMLLTDSVFLWAAIRVEQGSSDRLLGFGIPFWMLHQTLWATGLYWGARRLPIWKAPAITWRVARGKLGWMLSRQQGLLVIILVIVATGIAPSWTTTIWLILLLASRETLAVYERERLIRSQQEMQDQVVAANEQLRDYATQAEELAATSERNRSARDIHDGLGHYLAAILIQLKGARAVWRSDPERAHESINKAYESSKQALQEVRYSVAAVREGPFKQQPLPEVLGELVAKVRAGDIRATFAVAGTPHILSTASNYALYRAVQEGLTNASKHTEGAPVRVKLEYTPAQHVRLIIEDDGPGTASPEGGFGLVSMRERISKIGGTVNIVTAPGRGFRLEIEVPK